MKRLPIVLVAVAASAVFFAGCSLDGLRQNPALQAAAREQGQALLRDAVADAVRADAGGQTGAAESRLDEAVRDLGGDANAYATVGESVREQNRPALALRLLERGFQKARNGRDDPLLLAALARRPAKRQNG